MILWGPGSSIWLAAARIVCIEKDIAHLWERPTLPERGGEYDVTARFLSLQAPALRDGNFCLFTGEAILRYLDDAFPGPSLMPVYARGRGLASEMLLIIRDYVMESAIGALVMQRLFLPSFHLAPNPDICRQGTAVLKDALLVLEQLSLLAHDGEKSEFLAALDVTLPDIILMPIFFYLEQTEEGRELIAAQPRLGRWWLEAQKRHSLHKVADELRPPSPLP